MEKKFKTFRRLVMGLVITSLFCIGWVIFLYGKLNVVEEERKVLELKLYLIEQVNNDLKTENNDLEALVKEWDKRIGRLEAMFGGNLFLKSLEYGGVGGD